MEAKCIPLSRFITTNNTCFNTKVCLLNAYRSKENRRVQNTNVKYIKNSLIGFLLTLFRNIRNTLKDTTSK